MAKKTTKKIATRVEPKKPRERFVKVPVTEANMIEKMNELSDYSYVSILTMLDGEMYLLMEKT